jgi:hypothetical protein
VFHGGMVGARFYHGSNKGWQPVGGYCTPTRLGFTCVMHGRYDRDQGRWDHVDSVEDCQSEVIFLCGGEEARPHDCMPEGEASVLIGSVPCKVSSEVHMNGCRVMSIPANGERDMLAGTCLGQTMDGERT